MWQTVTPFQAKLNPEILLYTRQLVSFTDKGRQEDSNSSGYRQALSIYLATFG